MRVSGSRGYGQETSCPMAGPSHHRRLAWRSTRRDRSRTPRAPIRRRRRRYRAAPRRAYRPRRGGDRRPPDHRRPYPRPGRASPDPLARRRERPGAPGRLPGLTAGTAAAHAGRAHLATRFTTFVHAGPCPMAVGPPPGSGLRYGHRTDRQHSDQSGGASFLRRDAGRRRSRKSCPTGGPFSIPPCRAMRRSADSPRPSNRARSARPSAGGQGSIVPARLTPRLQAFPAEDVAFRRFVADAFATLLAEVDARPETLLEPEELQLRLRARYPAAVVRPRDRLADPGDGDVLWYVYRFGSVSPGLRWWEEPGHAWAILDDDRRFVEVSTSLTEIVEAPREAIIGQLVDVLANPEDASALEDIRALWAEFMERGELHATLRFRRLDGSPREIQYH